MSERSPSQSEAACRSDDFQKRVRQFRLDRAPGFLFRQLDARATSLFLSTATDPEITTRQFGVLLTLYKASPMLQSDLGRAMRIDKSTLGEMLGRMLDRGLVERNAWPKDRRVSQLSITDAGRALFESHFEGARRAQEELLAPLDPQERAILLEFLMRLTKDDGDGQ